MKPKLCVGLLSFVFLAIVDSRAEGQLKPRQVALAPSRGEMVLDFVSTAATGIAMNRRGDVVGTSYTDPGCGPFCLPPRETVVWHGEQRIVLPGIPGLSGITVRGISADGWVAGFAGVPGTTTHAVVWQPVGGSYVAIDLGTLPGTTRSEAIGIDDKGRVVGWSTTAFFPPDGSPFLWTAAGGMVDLSALGYPDESPLAISRGGTVATFDKWYRLGDPASVTTLASPPTSFLLGGEPPAINDAGDQARFLVTAGSQNLRYLYRYHHAGSWQMLSSVPNGNLSRYGVGSIDARGTVTATVSSAGVIAFGPDGLAQSLDSLLAPSYGDATVTSGGPMDELGVILAQVLIGRSPRLVRMTPAWRCGAACMQVEGLTLTATFVPDPSQPGSCSPSLEAHDEALVTLSVVTPGGAPLAGMQVSGRFLDDYWTDARVSGTTDATGSVSFPYAGLCGVGAIAFLVDDVLGGGLLLDKTAGELSAWAIPQ